MKLPTRAFRSWRTPAALNVLAVGTSLAAVTSAAFRTWGLRESTMAAISTLVMGTAWAASLRAKPKKGMRIGWILSPFFACANSMLCVALLTMGSKPNPLEIIGMMIIAGALIGAVVWIPALIATLLLFGLPIARAQRLASRGLAGADRGEVIVGVASAVLACVSFITMGHPIEMALAVTAIVCGISASTIAAFRERARRAFVRRVEAGEVAHFRVEPTALGKVLVRVTSTGMAYRVSDYVEEIATLSNEGDVTSTSRSAL